MLGPVVARGQGDLDQGAGQPAGGRDIAGETIIITLPHTHTAGGDIITPFISFILPPVKYCASPVVSVVRVPQLPQLAPDQLFRCVIYSSH